MRVLILLILTGAFSAFGALSVREYGAKGDGVAKDTAAVQAAIDAAAKLGGVVEVTPGRYLCGTIHLRSGVTLNLNAGAVILASPDEGDFDPYEKLLYPTPDDRETTYFHYALLAAEDAEDIAILGKGVIDGNRQKRGGPKTIALKNCRRVTIRGVTIRNAPNYSISLLGTDFVDIEGVTILNGYSDGIDPDSSRYVRIANCFIDTWDDAICPKASHALGRRRSTEHITVTNCVLSTSCSNFKLGTESGGDFKYITFSNSTMVRRLNPNVRAAISGVSIESVDGSNIDGITVNNITMEAVGTPIFVRLGNRGRGANPPVPGTLRNVILSNIVAKGGAMASSITGLPDHPVEGVSMDNLHLSMAGGAAAFGGLNVPEVPEKYPEATMFGVLPAYALYGRHVKGLTLRNVKVSSRQADARPALVLDDVRTVEVHAFRADTVPADMPLLWFHQVVGALISGTRIAEPTPVFLRVSGAESREISLLSNDLRAARRGIDLQAEVAAGAVSGDAR